MRHLRHEELQDLVEQLRAYDWEEAVRHLLACARCRSLAEQAFGAAARRDEGRLRPPPLWASFPAAPEDTAGDMRSGRRLLAALADRLKAAFADRKTAAALRDTLLARPAGERLSAITKDSGFLSPALAGALIEQAEEICGTEPTEAEHLAALAEAIAVRLPPPWSELERETLVGRALGWRGESLRERGDLEAAEQALAQTLELHQSLPVGNRERADSCRLLARLRWDQGRVDEALALMTRAVRCFEELPERRRALDCGTELGWMLLEELDSAEAAVCFEAARRAERFPDDWKPDAGAPASSRQWLALRHGLALAYADLGRDDAAVGLLKEVLGMAILLDLPRRDELLCRAACGSVYERLGQLREAERWYGEAWMGLMEEGAWQEGSRALLDLVQGLAEQGRAAEIEVLRARLRSVPDLPPAVWEALDLGLSFAAAHGVAAAEPLEAVRRYVKKARHNPRAELELGTAEGVPGPWQRKGRAEPQVH